MLSDTNTEAKLSKYRASERARARERERERERERDQPLNTHAILGIFF